MESVQSPDVAPGSQRQQAYWKDNKWILGSGKWTMEGTRNGAGGRPAAWKFQWRRLGRRPSLTGIPRVAALRAAFPRPPSGRVRDRFRTAGSRRSRLPKSTSLFPLTGALPQVRSRTGRSQRVRNFAAPTAPASSPLPSAPADPARTMPCRAVEEEGWIVIPATRRCSPACRSHPAWLRDP